MNRTLPWLAALVLTAGCGDTADPSTDSLSGRWRGTVNGIGIGFVTLDLTEDNHTLTGTGEWTPETGTGTASLTAQGLRFETDIQLSLTFTTATGPEVLVAPGRLLTADSFYLLFPTDPNPSRVTFERD